MKFQTMDCGREVGIRQIPTFNIVNMIQCDLNTEFCCVKHAEQFYQYDKDIENLSDRDFIWKYNQVKPPRFVTND